MGKNRHGYSWTALLPNPEGDGNTFDRRNSLSILRFPSTLIASLWIFRLFRLQWRALYSIQGSSVKASSLLLPLIPPSPIKSLQQPYLYFRDLSGMYRYLSLELLLNYLLKSSRLPSPNSSMGKLQTLSQKLERRYHPILLRSRERKRS